MKKIIFNCETITPMFLSGADKSKVELRPPSIKGAMRFWWRAMNGNLSLEQLKKKETLIFGGGGEDARKSKFNIKVEFNNIVSNKNIFKSKIAKNPLWYQKSVSLNKDIRVNPIEYLGFGPYTYKTKWEKYIPPKSVFKVTLLFNEFANEDTIDEAENAFLYFMSFGGLGSKNRNGFGQFRITNREYIQFEELKKYKCDSKNYSFFSNETKIFKLTNNQFQSWQEVLSVLGEEYRFAKLETDGAKHKYDNRKFIAAPVKKDIFKRKTKPYFLNIWEIVSTDGERNKFQGFILYLPYFNLTNDRAIYKQHYDESYPDKIKTACDEFNRQLLKSGKFTEVQL